MLAGDRALMTGPHAAFGIFDVDVNLKHSLGLIRVSPGAPISKFDIAFTGADGFENPTVFAAVPWRTGRSFEGVRGHRAHRSVAAHQLPAKSRGRVLSQADFNCLADCKIDGLAIDAFVVYSSRHLDSFHFG